MMRISVPRSSRWVAKLCLSVCTVTRLSMPAAARADRQAAYSTWTSIDLLELAAGKQPVLRPRQTPVGAQNAKQLRRQHDGAVLATLAVLDPDHHPPAVDVADLQADHLGGAQPRRIGRRQRGARLQAWHCLEKPHHLIGTQHHRQLARLPRIRDPLGNLVMAKRDAIEEPQSADRLVQSRPRDPARHQVDLERPHVLQAEPVRRPAEEAAELRDRVNVGSLSRRRQIADRHVLDHAAAQRAQIGHRKPPV